MKKNSTCDVLQPSTLFRGGLASAVATIVLATGGASTASGATVAWWMMEGNASSTVLVNSASTGTLFDVPIPTGASIQIGSPQPYVTDGENYYANTSSYTHGSATSGALLSSSAGNTIASLFTDSSFTIEAEVNAAFVMNYGAIFRIDSMLTFGTDGSGRFVFTGSDGFGMGVTATGTVLATGWRHIAVVGTWDSDAENTDVQLFINGAAVGNAVTFYGGLKDYTDQPFRIGGMTPFYGSINQLRISNEALAPSGFLSVTPIPEPSSMVLLAGAGLGLGWASFKRRKANQRLLV